MEIYNDKWSLPAEIHPIHKSFVTAGHGDFAGLYLMKTATHFVDTKQDTILHNQADEIPYCLLIMRTTSKTMHYIYIDASLIN